MFLFFVELNSNLVVLELLPIQISNIFLFKLGKVFFCPNKFVLDGALYPANFLKSY